mgnify:CR=1 FL=1
MTVVKTSYLYDKDGYDYKYLFGRNNNDDKVMASFFRVVGTTTWYPLVEEVVLFEMGGGQ